MLNLSAFSIAGVAHNVKRRRTANVMVHAVIPGDDGDDDEGW